MILTGRKAIGEHYGIKVRAVSIWANEKGMPHTRIRDEDGNMIPEIETDSVDEWLIQCEVDKVKERLALAKKRG
jgi:hypothetical protein